MMPFFDVPSLLERVLIFITNVDGCVISFAPNIAKHFRFLDNNFKELAMGDFSLGLTTLQKVRLAVESDNTFDKPAPMKAGTVAEFAVDKSGIITVLPADDGSFVDIDAVGVGVAVITVSGVATDGSKFSNLVTVTITLDPREAIATHFKFTEGPVVDQ